MIPKSGYRFSEKIMLKQEVERDDDSKRSHRALSDRRSAAARTAEELAKALSAYGLTSGEAMSLTIGTQD